MRSSIAVAIAALMSIAANGCLASRFAAKSAVALTHDPAKIEHKISDPVRPDARLAVLWIGHATALVQIDDKFILTDPVFTRSVGQLSTRVVEPGLDVERLPPIDAVLISHMHFDHLSLGSLDAIESKTRRIVVPRGGVVYLPASNVPATELGPWRTYTDGDFTITAVPNRHVGWRYGIDAAWMTAFSAYVVRYHGITVYFGGDTAYVESDFEAIARAFPHIDLALLPIAPLRPRAFMERTHEDPWEAVHAFLDLHADHMVPIHFETFFNSTDDLGDARRELTHIKEAMRLDDDRLPILHIGEQRVFIRK